MTAPPMDPRLLELLTEAARLCCPGSEYFIAVAFRDRQGIATGSNIAAARQPELLRVLLDSFDSGRAETVDVVALVGLDLKAKL